MLSFLNHLKNFSIHLNKFFFFHHKLLVKVMDLINYVLLNLIFHIIFNLLVFQLIFIYL